MTASDDTVQAWLTTVAGPGAVPAAVTITSAFGSFDFSTALSGAAVTSDPRAAKEQPDSEAGPQ